MRIKVLDHIIIGENKYYSFSGEGLIEEFESDFMNIMLRGTSEARRRLYQARITAEKPNDRSR